MLDLARAAIGYDLRLPRSFACLALVRDANVRWSYIRRAYVHGWGSATTAPMPMPTPAPAPVPMPAPTHAPAVTADGTEQLPRYEPPPPYERIAKTNEQRPVEMRDLERGESTANRSGDPPVYQATADTSDGRVSVRRIDTDGSHVGEPLPPPPRAMLYVRRVFGGFNPFSR